MTKAAVMEPPPAGAGEPAAAKVPMRRAVVGTPRRLVVRAVDFVANPGGGRRFLTELLRALAAARPEAEIEVVSGGAGCAALRSRLGEMAAAVRVRGVGAPGAWAHPLIHALRIPGLRVALRALDLGAMWHYSLPPALAAGCDVLWLPWVHRHRLPARLAGRVVGSYHDDTFLDFAPRAAGHPHSYFVADETRTTRDWLASPARLVASSETTRQRVARRFGVAEARFDVVSLAGDHLPRPVRTAADTWPWAAGRYLLCPASFGHHKNHEVLLRGVAAWGARWPLVLTGPGATLPGPRWQRSRRVASALLRGAVPRVGGAAAARAVARVSPRRVAARPRNARGPGVCGARGRRRGGGRADARGGRRQLPRLGGNRGRGAGRLLRHPGAA